MTTEQPVRGTERPPLLRSRRDRVLGGVCAGIAEHLGVSSLVIRLAVLALIVFSGGTAVLVYLIAWVLIPPATAESSWAPQEPPAAPANDGGPREAWNAVGEQLKVLAADFRASRPTPTAEPAAEASQPPRSPVATVDSAMTSLGQRLRDPQVQAGARQAATGLSVAIKTSVDQVGRRNRRGEAPDPGATEPSTSAEADRAPGSTG